VKSILLVVAIFVVVAAVALCLWMAKGTKHLSEMQSAYEPNPDNRSSIDVVGWKQDEINRILADFRGNYGLPDSSLAVTKHGDGQFRVSFPHDIEPRIFFFLVNYIRYPKEMDLRARRIGVLGRARLSRAYGIPDSSLDGKSARFYVPANDKEFDNIYVQLESGRAFKIPFTRLIWESVDDPRLPDEIKDEKNG
jgi:hypothetical protein